MIPGDRAALVAAVAAGLRPSFLAFPDWGGAPPLGWLSAWTLTPFERRGVHFPSAEHCMMYDKACLFGDTETATRILRVRTSFQAQALGRQVRTFREAVWLEARERVAFEANWAKFSGIAQLGDYLLETSPAVLVQASPLDGIWGAELDPSSPELGEPGRWRGLNLMGFSLVRVRRKLAERRSSAR